MASPTSALPRTVQEECITESWCVLQGSRLYLSTWCLWAEMETSCTRSLLSSHTRWAHLLRLLFHFGKTSPSLLYAPANVTAPPPPATTVRFLTPAGSPSNTCHQPARPGVWLGWTSPQLVLPEPLGTAVLKGRALLPVQLLQRAPRLLETSTEIKTLHSFSRFSCIVLISLFFPFNCWN